MQASESSFNASDIGIATLSWSVCSVMAGEILCSSNWLIGDRANGMWGVEDHLHRIPWPAVQTGARLGERGRDSDRIDLHHCGWDRGPCAAWGIALELLVLVSAGTVWSIICDSNLYLPLCFSLSFQGAWGHPQVSACRHHSADGDRWQH